MCSLGNYACTIIRVCTRTKHDGCLIGLGAGEVSLQLLRASANAHNEHARGKWIQGAAVTNLEDLIIAFARSFGLVS